MGCESEGLYILDSKKSGKEKAFGGMVATARDISRLGQLILNNGVWNSDTLLKPEYIKLLTTLPYNNKTYTYGMWTSTYKGKRFYYQAGVKGQFCISLPEYNMVVTRLGRKASPKRSVEDTHKDIFDYIKEALRIAELSSKS